MGRKVIGAELSFNGATTKVSWKAWSASVMIYVKPTLQWGHDKGVVEGGMSDAELITQGKASMGPRQRCRGRHRKRIARRSERYGLQWGHDKGVVEGGRRSRSTALPIAMLQWGHDKGVVEGLTRG